MYGCKQRGKHSAYSDHGNETKLHIKYKERETVKQLYIVFFVSNVKEKILMFDKPDKYLFTKVFSKFELNFDNFFCE